MRVGSYAAIIGNPSSGRAGSRDYLERCAKILRSGGVEAVILNTECPDHATELAASTEAPLVVAAGGDGTINEVINGLGENATLGIIPLGTANVLARELGLPLDVELACERIVRGERARVDLGVATNREGVERRFACMAGIGFDANVVRAVTPRLKRRLRGLAFALMAFKVLASQDFPPVRVIHGGETHLARFAIVANAHHYGGELRAASDPALLARGELEVVLVGRVSALLRPDILASVLARRPLDRHMRSFAARELHACVQARAADAAPDADVPVQLDGEVWGYLPMSFRIEPRALEVIR